MVTKNWMAENAVSEVKDNTSRRPVESLRPSPSPPVPVRNPLFDIAQIFAPLLLQAQINNQRSRPSSRRSYSKRPYAKKPYRQNKKKYSKKKKSWIPYGKWKKQNRR